MRGVRLLRLRSVRAARSLIRRVLQVQEAVRGIPEGQHRRLRSPVLRPAGREPDRQAYVTVRSDFLTTCLRPDQTSLTAHTLMSTYPIGSATSRIVSSVMSVGTFDDF